MTRSIFQRYSRDGDGKAIASAEVNVIVSGGAVANIYSAPTGGTPITQPLLSDSNGFFKFYVEPGIYDVSATNTANSTTATFLREEIGASRESLTDDDQHAAPYSPLNEPSVTSTTNMVIEVVEDLPANPDANTLYIVVAGGG